jgi:hypothetical protein
LESNRPAKKQKARKAATKRHLSLIGIGARTFVLIEAGHRLFGRQLAPLGRLNHLMQILRTCAAIALFFRPSTVNGPFIALSNIWQPEKDAIHRRQFSW